MNLIMLGPGYGHNIEPYLDYYNRRHLQNKLTFIYWGALDFNVKFNNVEFIRFEKNNIFKIYNIINDRNNSMIWQHGNNIIIYALIRLFKSKKIIHFLNIWSDRLYLEVKKSKLKRLISRIVLNNAYIHCYWYTTADHLISQIPNAKYKTIDCGMHKDLFLDEHNSSSKSFHSLINSIKSMPGKKFFYPKSMTSASGHFLILESVKKLIDNGVCDFRVVFRRGNEINKKFEECIKLYISENGLEEYVVIQEYSYLSFMELALLWKEMDCGLQIAFHDQLSTTFLEPMLFGKELIASNIKPYQIYKEKYDIELELCELNSDSIYVAMKKVCLNGVSDQAVLDYRKQNVVDHFNFEENVNRITEYYGGLRGI